MNGCSAMQAKFSEYLDGRLTGREMQRIAAHLDRCRDCAGEWLSLRKTQASLARPGTGCGARRSAAAHSRGGKPGAGTQPQEPSRGLEPGVEKYGRTVPAAGWRGFASAVLLLGTVTVLVAMFTQPEMAQAKGRAAGQGDCAAAALSLQWSGQQR